MAPQRRRALAAALALLVLAGGAGFYAVERRGAQAELTLPAGSTLEAAQLEALRPLPDFTLERLGAPLTAAELRGRWSFVFFGYTNCPDACPQTLGLLGHVQEALRAQQLPVPRVVFVSLDPQRDTPQVLHDYLAAFDADALGATGSPQALHDLLGYFGVSVERKEGAGPAGYTLDHTANLFLVTPDGRWLATFGPSADPEAVLADTQALLRARLPG